MIDHYESFFYEKYRLDAALFIRMAQHALYTIQFVHSQGIDHNYKIRFKKKSFKLSTVSIFPSQRCVLNRYSVVEFGIV